MNKTKTVKILSLLLCVAAAAVQLWLVAAYYEPTSYFYKYGSVPPVVFHVSLAVLTVLFALSSLLFPKEESEPGQTVFGKIVSLLGGLLLAGGAVIRLIDFILNGTSSLFFYSAGAKIALIVSTVFAVPAAIYYLFRGLGLFRTRRAEVLPGICAIIWAAFYLIFIYFRMTEPLNSPFRVLRMFALLALMLYLTTDIRWALGKPDSRRWRAFAPIAVLLLLVSAVTELVFTCTGMLAVTQFLPFTAALVCIAADIAQKYAR